MKSDWHEGRNVAKRRRLCGLTQYDLARETDISPTRLAYFETGRVLLFPFELNRIRAAPRRRAKAVLRRNWKLPGSRGGAEGQS